MVCCCVKKRYIHQVHYAPWCVLQTDMHEQVETLYYTINQLLSNSGVHLHMRFPRVPDDGTCTLV